MKRPIVIPDGMTLKKDVLIIGAGAAGLMCAIESGKRGRSVLVIDHSSRPGRKIRASGGGRSNFTNLNAGSDNYYSRNPHFCKSALSRFTPRDFVAMIERYGIGYHEKENGQLFCNDSSARITDMLQKECNNAGAEILLNCRVGEITRTDLFEVHTNMGDFQAESLVIATGGPSHKELGASGFGYRIAQKLGIRLVPLRPALVPFRWNGKDLRRFGELSGASTDVIVTCNGVEFRGGLLFTHEGLSGPAVLQVSCVWNRGDAIHINLLPEHDPYELLAAKRQSKSEMKNFLSQYVPKRLAQKWCDLYAPSRPLYQCTEKELRDAAFRLRDWEVLPAGTEGYAKAEVTLGGVDTGELSSKTMEAKKVPGLYFIGEIVDVTGQLGGFNLQWAWSSGYAAGQYA